MKISEVMTRQPALLDPATTIAQAAQTMRDEDLGCLLIGRELFEELGGFDEGRPVTHNDVDLCRRARELGRLVTVTPHARLLHYESLSRGYAPTPPDHV